MRVTPRDRGQRPTHGSTLVPEQTIFRKAMFVLVSGASEVLSVAREP